MKTALRRIALIASLLAAFVTAAQQGVNQKQGFNANNVYSMHDIDTVNAFNGNLTVAIPIGPEFPLADGFSYRLTLHSNGNFWDHENRSDTYTTYNDPNAARDVRADASDACDPSDGYTVAFPHRRANAGLGWMLTLGRLYPSASTLVRGWTYQSADGADHPFHGTLHEGDTAIAGMSYTRDGTYLRLNRTQEGSGLAVVEFPDGTYHTFKKTSTNSEAPWLPIEIAHRRSTQKLTINYDVPNQWTLTDTHGRQHVITFAALPWESATRRLVTSVRLEVFDQKEAVYDFGYQELTALPRPDWHERCSAWPSTAKVQTLKTVTFPSEAGEGTTKYEFGYDLAPLQSPGVLSRAVLPTGGWITWQWDTWEKPQDSAGRIFLAESVGVVKRQMWVPNGTPAGSMVAEWTYDSSLDTTPTDQITDVEVRTVIKDPLNQKTVHFFAATVRDETRSTVVYRSEYYGLPFTQKHLSGDGHYLSQVVYPAGVEPDLEHPLTGATRATYLFYEGDSPASTVVGPEKNWRVKSKRESFGSETIDTVNSDFDGYGNYRVTSVSGSFDTSAKRTTTTSYAAPATHWILGLYDSTKVTDATGQSSVTEFSFDSDGFLSRTRKRRNASGPSVNDIITVFQDDDNDGMVEAERHYGGDAADKALQSDYDIDQPSEPQVLSYSLTHTSENGLRAMTESDGASFKAVDLDIDRSGLPRSSTDVSGTYTTTFDFNLRGQLKSVKPGSDAWTEYKYNTNTADFPPASVVVRQWKGTVVAPGATDAPLTEKRYYYDYFGRLIQERTWLSSASTSAWSVVTHQYDPLGRRISTSVPVGRTSGTYSAISLLPSTITEYDVLGRIRKVTQPDGKYTEAVYTGASTVDRSVEIKTETGDERIENRETYDPLGRLTSITEDFGGTGAEATTYTYDVGDRLATVTQSTQSIRQFSYDSAGLLTSETHPESGTTSYSYDARGHVIKKITPTATVTTTYDTAERIETVAQAVTNGLVTTAIPLQSFTYGSAGSSKGRVATATRHNHHLDLGGDIEVTESFTYTADGRVSTKTTSVTNGPTFTDRYTYEFLGARETVEYPDCAGCGSLTPPARTVKNVYTAGLLTGVDGYTNDITYHPNGVIATLKRRNANGLNGPTLTQTIDAENRMARPATTTISGQCEFAITVPPPASTTVAVNSPANISVTAPGATTYEWYILGSTTKIANQSTATLTIPVSQTTQFWVRVGNGTCTVDSPIATVYAQSCAAPDTTISAPASVGPGSEGTATVAGVGTYLWSISNGSGEIVSGANAQTVTFRSFCSGPVRLAVRVTAACGTFADGTKDVAVVSPSVTVSANPGSIVQGQSTTLSVTIAGGPWSVNWSDGYAQTGVAGTVSRPAVSPSQTTTYTIAKINGCTGSYPSATIIVAPPAPLTTNALRTSGGIQVTWSMPGGASADGFIVERCASNCASGAATWSTVGTPSVLSFVDGSAVSGAAYVYRVRAVKAGTPSQAGPIDFAVRLAFSDEPIVAGATPILLTHLSELRSAVNALRSAAGLSPASFTDTLTSGLSVRAIHFTELRAALNGARAQLGFAAVAFEPTVAAGTVIGAAHVN
jgi:YD repeat-containing protein